MSLASNVLLFSIGLFGLWVGAHMAISGSLKISKQFGISTLFIGLTVISIGTSLPEIFTHLVSSFKILKGIDASGVSVGANIGSNIIQITFILGLIGLLATVKSSKNIQRRDGLVMLGAIALLWLFGLNGHISRLEGVILAVLYLVYMFYLSRGEKSLEEMFEVGNHHKFLIGKKARHNISVASGTLLAGIVLLLLSAKFVVDGAIFLSDFFGVAQTLVGTMVVGVSTALPELTTALVGIKRGAKNLSLGVLIGSNITNPMLALGLGAAISGYTMAKEIIWFDIPFWFIISTAALLFFNRNHRLEKGEALFLILSYIAYAVYKFYSI